jgi:hypothetical protein
MDSIAVSGCPLYGSFFTRNTSGTDSLVDLGASFSNRSMKVWTHGLRTTPRTRKSSMIAPWNLTVPNGSPAVLTLSGITKLSASRNAVLFCYHRRRVGELHDCGIGRSEFEEATPHQPAPSGIKPGEASEFRGRRVIRNDNFAAAEQASIE